MIKSFLVCDSEGYPFYSRTIEKGLVEIDKTMLSGLISAIGTIGKKLFNQELATITYGSGKNTSNIIIISKKILTTQKVIYFVFFTQEECNHNLMNQISTTIFIETKPMLKNSKIANESINKKIDDILDHKFFGLVACD